MSIIDLCLYYFVCSNSFSFTDGYFYNCSSNRMGQSKKPMLFILGTVKSSLSSSWNPMSNRVAGSSGPSSRTRHQSATGYVELKLSVVDRSPAVLVILST